VSLSHSSQASSTSAETSSQTHSSSQSSGESSSNESSSSSSSTSTSEAYSSDFETASEHYSSSFEDIESSPPSTVSIQKPSFTTGTLAGPSEQFNSACLEKLRNPPPQPSLSKSESNFHPQLISNLLNKIRTQRSSTGKENNPRFQPNNTIGFRHLIEKVKHKNQPSSDWVEQVPSSFQRLSHVTFQHTKKKPPETQSDVAIDEHKQPPN
jgi:hypothetical protein